MKGGSIEPPNHEHVVLTGGEGTGFNEGGLY